MDVNGVYSLFVHDFRNVVAAGSGLDSQFSNNRVSYLEHQAVVAAGLHDAVLVGEAGQRLPILDDEPDSLYTYTDNVHS